VGSWHFLYFCEFPLLLVLILFSVAVRTARWRRNDAIYSLTLWTDCCLLIYRLKHRQCLLLRIVIRFDWNVEIDRGEQFLCAFFVGEFRILLYLTLIGDIHFCGKIKRRK